MSYDQHHPMQLTLYPSSGSYRQLQQTPWNFEHGEDRTSVTNPSTSNEAVYEGTFQISSNIQVRFYQALQKYLELRSEPLQDILVSTQSWYYLVLQS
jgi:hypothetical protein